MNLPTTEGLYWGLYNHAPKTHPVLFNVYKHNDMLWARMVAVPSHNNDGRYFGASAYEAHPLFTWGLGVSEWRPCVNPFLE